jgi:hypothetical protein
MITNIAATILVTLVTNVYAPKQYKVTHYYATCPVTVVEEWVDNPGGEGYYGFLQEPTTRDNPDVRITEVREIKTLSFEFDGKEWKAEVSNNIVSSKRGRRVVDEKWVDE